MTKKASGPIVFVDVTATLKVAVKQDDLDVDKEDFEDDYDGFSAECQDKAIEKAEAFINGLVATHPNEIKKSSDVESEFDEDSPKFVLDSDDDDED